MKLDDLLTRVDELIEQGGQVLATRHKVGSVGEFVDFGPTQGFRSAGLSFIERVYSSTHPHYLGFEKCAITSPTRIEGGIEVLRVVKTELEGGWLFTVKGLVSAEIFSDFLDMAEYLLDERYKDPAAVLIGGVLEEHLRQLCNKNGIDSEDQKADKTVPKKADRLNADLAKADVYSKLDLKSVTAWLELRNKAAHGKYAEYSHEQVENMLRGVTEFMARLPLSP